jgi:uncharacterized heparinase superfamily protein
MGSVSRMDRCTRFIREFGADYVRKFGFHIGAKLVVVAEGLAFDDRDECVRFEMAVRPEGSDSEEVRFHLEPVIFAPDAAPDDQIAQIADDLELDAGEVGRRLAKLRPAGRRG